MRFVIIFNKVLCMYVYASAAYAVMRCPSVSDCLFVHLSRSWILSKK